MIRSITAVAVPCSFLLLAIYLRNRTNCKLIQKKPALKRRAKSRLPSGIINVGNSCYLASVLQLLASAGEPLISHFRELDNKVALTLSELLEKINSGEGRKVRPIEFIKSFSGSFMGLSPDQQDAHEFLLALLNMNCSRNSKYIADSINLDINGSNSRSLFSAPNPFTGVLMNELICLPCASKRNPRHISSLRIEPFSCVTLIPDSSNLSISAAVYRHFCAPEKYSDYCNYKDGVKCGMGAVNQKHPLIFPQLLFLHVSQMTGNSLMKTDQIIRTEIELSGPGYRYKLNSLIVHIGNSAVHGHFICYRTHGDVWIECNDENVKIVSEETILGQRAYILLYQLDL